MASRTQRGGPKAARATPALGDRVEFTCPVCGDGNADATYIISRIVCAPEWRIDCFSESCKVRRGAYLGDLGDSLGLGHFASKDELVAALRHYGRRLATTGAPETPPTEAHFAGWHQRLLASREALDRLQMHYGLTLATIRQHQIGYGTVHGRPLAFMIPVRDSAGGLLTVVERFWPQPWRRNGKPVKKRVLRGHGSHLFPELPSEGPILLAAGMFDALATRQHGLPGVTPTSGTSLKPELRPAFAGRHVAVVYDVGEEASAARNAARLREVGADAWVVRLGLRRKGADVADWFARYGRSADQLTDRIQRARRASTRPNESRARAKTPGGRGGRT
jgi:hypothetical protein